MIANINELADRLTGIKVDGKDLTIDMLKENISSEKETKLEITEGIFLTNDKLIELKETIKKQGYEEARTPIAEMQIKEMKQVAGLDFEGKDSKMFIDKYKDKILSNAAIKPNEKITELETSLQNLQNTYKKDLDIKDNEIKNYQTQVKKNEINTKLFYLVPEKLQGIKKQQVTLLFQNEYNIDIENENLVAKKNGTILKDNMGKPIFVESLMNDFVTQNKWLQTDGRGGENETGDSSKFKNEDEAMEYMEKNKIDVEGSEGLKILNSLEKS